MYLFYQNPQGNGVVQMLQACKYHVLLALLAVSLEHFPWVMGESGHFKGKMQIHLRYFLIFRFLDV